MRTSIVIALALGGAQAFQASAPARPATKLQAYVPSGMSPEEYAKLKKRVRYCVSETSSRFGKTSCRSKTGPPRRCRSDVPSPRCRSETPSPRAESLTTYPPSQEADAKKKKNFGAGGARGFESRSMASFMRAQERGEAEHLFPVDPEKVKTGEIPLKDVPYMQRGGSWTNSDLTGKKGWMNTGFGMYAFNDGKAKKAKANKFDAMYNPGSKRDGFSVGIFGEAGALDWTGRGARSGGGAEAGSKDGVTARAQKNGISADMQMWRDAGAVDPKKLQQNRWGRGGAPKIDVAKAKQPEKKFFGLF